MMQKLAALGLLLPASLMFSQSSEIDKAFTDFQRVWTTADKNGAAKVISDVLLALTGFSLADTARELYFTWHQIDTRGLLLQLALPVWLTIGYLLADAPTLSAARAVITDFQTSRQQSQQKDQPPKPWLENRDSPGYLL